MRIENEFQLGQVVYLKIDKEQLPRMVTQLTININLSIYYTTYCVINGQVTESSHYGHELTTNENIQFRLKG